MSTQDTAPKWEDFDIIICADATLSIKSEVRNEAVLAIAVEVNGGLSLTNVEGVNLDISIAGKLNVQASLSLRHGIWSNTVELFKAKKDAVALEAALTSVTAKTSSLEAAAARAEAAAARLDTLAQATDITSLADTQLALKRQEIATLRNTAAASVNSVRQRATDLAGSKAGLFASANAAIGQAQGIAAADTQVAAILTASTGQQTDKGALSVKTGAMIAKV